ncbi:hypothetical protein EVAR_12491_1 [Eumeta japonica]|uniref:Uncharacterized protein n=1 Tax=Eumeta variegata TaxID=151549 RepID=A0A4C1TPJ8_EUMVA|nr:hypothetical protein EVAR_12491_1 [Eumeta japonica]
MPSATQGKSPGRCRSDRKKYALFFKTARIILTADYSKVLPHLVDNHARSVPWQNASHQDGADGISSERNDDGDYCSRISLQTFQNIDYSIYDKASIKILHLFAKKTVRVCRKPQGRRRWMRSRAKADIGVPL